MIGGFGCSAVNHHAGNALVFELHGPRLAARQTGLDDHSQLDGSDTCFLESVEKGIHSV